MRRLAVTTNGITGQISWSSEMEALTGHSLPVLLAHWTYTPAEHDISGLGGPV
jgi:hypothetical protein